MNLKVTTPLLISLFFLHALVAEAALEPSGVDQMRDKEMTFPGEAADIDWVNWAVVVTHPGHIARHDYVSPRHWTDEERFDFLRDYDPDHIDSWWGTPFMKSDVARSRGISVGGGMEYEYESGIHGVQYFERRIFGKNGLGVRENGSAATQSRYNTFGMTHMAPKWHHTVKTGTQRHAPFSDSLNHDNIIHGIGHPFGQWDPYANRFFQEYLEENFSPEQLSDWGVQSVEDLNMRGHLKRLRDQGLSNEEIVDDPVIKEYVRFHYVELTRRLINIINQAKLVAVKEGHAVPAWYGNLSGMAKSRSMGLTLSQFVDVVAIEHGAYGQPSHRGGDSMDAYNTLIYKSGDAAGSYAKPVWGIISDGKYQNPYRRLSQAMQSADAVANGGVKMQFHTTRDIPEGVSRDVQRHHAQLAGQNRVFFTDRERIARVGLIRSVPNEHWGYFSTLGFDRPHLTHYSSAARVLEDHHIPYEITIFGHPDFFDDSVHLARLERYDTLILPYGEAVADYQVEALEDWVRAGGKLVLLGDYGTMDEDRNPREKNAFEGLIEDPGKGEVAFVSSETAEAYREMDAEAEAAIAEVFRREDPILETNGDEMIWYNLYRHGAGPMLSLAMMNYEIEPFKDTVVTKQDIEVGVRVENPDVYTHAYYITDDYKTPGAPVPEMVELPLEKDGDFLRVTIPSLDILGVIAFATEDEFAARSQAADLRKWHNRYRIAKRARWQELTPEDEALLAEAAALLDTVQGDAEVSDFAAAEEACRAMAGRLESGVRGVTMDVIRQDAASRLENQHADAEYRFDFGPEEYLTHGWLPVTEHTPYSPERGYGWTDAVFLKALRAHTGDDLHGDYIRSQDPREQLPGISFHYPFIVAPPWDASFRVDLPNGDYIVTVVAGDELTHYNQNRVGITYVDANGEPALYGDRILNGFYENRSFPVTVEDGSLELRFWGRNTGALYANNCDWLVNALIIQKPDALLSEATQASVSRTKLHDRAVIRDWMVIGPFDDPDCMGLDIDYAAEEVDLDGTYEGQDGEVAWKPVTDLEGMAPTVYFSQLFFGEIGKDNITHHYTPLGPGIEPAVALAVTFVYVPQDMEAVLESSSTQMAQGFVNGEEVFRNEIMAGVLPEEDRVRIHLKQGWNEILLKTTCYWGSEWASWMSLYDADGTPLAEVEGVLIDPLGNGSTGDLESGKSSL